LNGGNPSRDKISSKKLITKAFPKKFLLPQDKSLLSNSKGFFQKKLSMTNNGSIERNKKLNAGYKDLENQHPRSNTGATSRIGKDDLKSRFIITMKGTLPPQNEDIGHVMDRKTAVRRQNNTKVSHTEVNELEVTNDMHVQ
jgi:hypothetical protein